jgi:transposase
LCHQVRSLNRPVAEAARDFGVSRKTAYKWLGRFEPQAGSRAMKDRPKRPLCSPAKVGDDVEAAILRVRDTYGWGPRKIHAVLRRESCVPLPCLKTVANVLKRCGRVASPARESPEVQRFERTQPNQLWQVDHKGPIEVGVGGSRQKLVPRA